MNKFVKLEYIIRLIIVISILVYVNLYNFDYKIPLSILSFSYFIGSLILLPLRQGDFLKHFLYIIDTSIIVYFTFTTGSIYFSIFWIPFLFYMKKLHDVILFSIYTFIVFGIPLYISNFSDFTLIFILFSFVVVLFKSYFETKYYKERISHYNDLAKEMYKENLKCTDKLEFYKKFYNIHNTISLFKKGKLDPQIFVNNLFENLNADSVILYNRSLNDFTIKSLYKIDLDDINIEQFEDKIYINEHFNSKLGFKYIISKHFDGYILLIFYKNAILDGEEILKLIV